MFHRILSHLGPYRWRLALGFGQVLVLTGLEVLKPWPLKIVIDHVLAQKVPSWWRFGGPGELLLAAVLALVAVYALHGAVVVWNNMTTIAIGQALVNDLRSQLYGHLQRLSLAFHARWSLGDLIYRVTTDTYAIQAVAMNGLFPIVASILLLGGMFGVMLRMDWVLTLVALGICPLLLAGILVMNRRMVDMATEAREKESAVYELVQRNLAAIRVVQAFSKEEEEHGRFVAGSRASLRSALRLYTVQTAYGAGTSVAVALGTGAVLWVGSHHVWQGTLSVGDMVVFVSYLASLYAPINQIVQTYAMVQSSQAGVRRVFDILDQPHGLPDGSESLPAPVRGEVVLRDVHFAYEAGKAILRGVNLTARPGETIAIVGATGAGKSTMVGLIPRFHDPESGVVEVDGRDVRRLRLTDLRRQVSMVLQPPIVFPVTVHENIAYGRVGATRAEVEQAARLAQADEFIRRLPGGYDSVIGEQGATLSEGERQRLTIARAILRDAPILILDEPTSSVDATTEAAIMRALDELMRGRTTFVIAHRLSTVRRATRIVVLRDGRIAESGTFEELMARRGAFHALYESQFGDVAEDGVALLEAGG